MRDSSIVGAAPLLLQINPKIKLIENKIQTWNNLISWRPWL